MAGLIAVVACDKPPVGTLAAILEHNAPAVLLSDGSIKPGTDPRDRRADRHRDGLPVRRRPRPRHPHAHRAACLPGPGQLRRHVHLQHDADLHRRARYGAAADGRAAVRRPSPPEGVPGPADRLPGRDDRRRDHPARHRHAGLAAQRADGHDRDGRIDQRACCTASRSRAPPGFDLWEDVLSQSEFNALSRRLPVLVNMRPFGFYSMVDIDAKGGLQVIVKELLERRPARRRGAHLHRRDAGRAGPPARSAARPTGT